MPGTPPVILWQHRDLAAGATSVAVLGATTLVAVIQTTGSQSVTALLPPAEIEANFDLDYHYKHVDTIFARVFG